ncbi:MAG: ABC transporter permease [Acidimicrobiales bacterium]
MSEHVAPIPPMAAVQAEPGGLAVTLGDGVALEERAAVAPEGPGEHWAGDAGGGDKALSSLRRAVAIFFENKLAVISLGIFVLIVLFSFIGPLIYHTNQTATNLLQQSLPPSSSHPLGTSPGGRDELGRLMVGGQSTLEVGILVGVVATLFGLVWGLVAGYAGGWVDAVLMRIVDAVLSIPYLFFAVLLASLVTPNLELIVGIIAAVSWLSTARLARGETLRIRTLDYVAAAKSFGSRRKRILARHVTPNMLGAIVVNFTLKVADAILTFAAISFLGIGLPPPATNWGTMLTAGVNNLFDGFWWQLWPAAIFIVLTVLAVNVLGDALSDVIEGRLKAR